MGISKASASRCVHDVAECLCEMAQDWIKFPTASGDINVNKYDLVYTTQVNRTFRAR